jgi:hypothetical protein
MNISKLKAIFITACCFVVALCLEIKSMDTTSDIQETTSYKAKHTNSESCLDSLKNEMGSNSPSARLLLNQDENKDSTPWVFYVSSPVKAVINGTYNIVDFAVKHPTQTIITSLLIAAQFTAVAADCNCILQKQMTDQYGKSYYTPYTFGQFPNETECKNFSKDFSQAYSGMYGCN